MIPSVQHKNRVIRVDHSPLVENAVSETYLTSSASSGGSTITVKSITGFAVSQVILLGELGEKSSEIILAHAATSPSGSTITMASNLVRSHNAGTKVRALLFNQFELSHATTLTGDKTVLTVANGEPPSGLGTGLVAIDPTSRTQKYQDIEYTTGYYFVRYKHSIDTTFGGYCDGIVYGGWDESTVGYMIDQVLKRLGKTLSSKLTREFFYNEINECLRKIKGKQLRWPEHAEEDYIAGQTSRGTNKITLPTDIYDDDTNKSITGVRIGTDMGLTYLDPTMFEAQKVNVAQTQVRTEASASDTELAVDNSYDFNDTGTVSVYVSGTKYDIEYDGITRDDAAGATAEFTDIDTDQITVTIAVDTNVWQNETEGTPLYYTVRDGELEFWPLPDSSNDNMNVYLDYDKVVTEVNSEGDVIDLNRYGIVLDYLTWKTDALTNNNSKLDMNSAWYISYRESLNDAIRTSVSGKKFRWIPNINRMSRGTSKNFVSINDRRGLN